MTRTLANMTPAEQAECVGMWADNLVSTAKTPSPVVLACVQGECCWVLHTTLHGEWSRFPLDAVAPRFDLPRAWTPDGQPVDAADTLEYRVEHQHIEGGMWHSVTQWSPEWPLNDGHSVAPDERIVCRRVSAPWGAGSMTAGAAALDTLDRVRDALTKIAQERERARARIDDAPTHYDWGQEVGREHAYGNAYNIITEALGDTP